MTARSRTGLLALGLVLLAALAWIGARGAGGGAGAVTRHPNTAQQGGVTPRTPETSALGSRRAEGLAARTVAGAGVDTVADEAPIGTRIRGTRVRSSADIPLPHVELRAHAPLAVGGWRRVERDEDLDGVQVDIDTRSEVRAPGHLLAILEPGTPELVLEPDALLELFAPDLEDRVDSIQPWESWESARERWISSGFVDESTWRLAVSTEASRVVLDHGDILTVRTRSGGVLRVYFRGIPPPGLRARCELPLLEPGKLAPLEVLVEGAGEAPGGTPPLFRAELYDRTESRVLARYPWGSVHDHGQAPRKLASHEGRIVFDDLPLGRSYSLRLSDSTTGDSGSLERVHDGSPWRLTLGGGLVVRAMVLSEGARPHTGRVSVQWGWRSEQGAKLTGRYVYVWGDGQGDAEVVDGHLEVVIIPRSYADSSPSRLARPERIDLRLLAPGCGELGLELHVSLGDRELDLGTLQLRPRPPELTLAPAAAGTGAPAVASGDVGHVVLSGEVEGWYSIELARESGDVIDVFLKPWALRDHEEATGSRRIESARLVVLPPGAHEIAAMAFERGEDGFHRPVPMRRHAMRVRAASDLPGQIRLGWAWGDCRHVVGHFAPGTEIEVEFRAPPDAKLYWHTADKSRAGELDLPPGFDLWLIP